MELEVCNEQQAIKLLSEAKVALLPLGATEPHGNHLPLATDTLLATEFAKRIDQHFGEETVLLPTIPFGQVWSLQHFAGAIDIGSDLLSELLIKIARNMREYGIDTLAVINTHFGNFDAMKTAARTLKTEGVTLISITWPGTRNVALQLQESASPHPSFMHADEIETSLACYLIPESVDLDSAQANYPEFPPHFSSVPFHWTEFSHTAVLGDPTKASAAKGAKLVQASLEAAIQIITDFKGIRK